jgi:hypothetical protein
MNRSETLSLAPSKTVDFLTRREKALRSVRFEEELLFFCSRNDVNKVSELIGMSPDTTGTTLILKLVHNCFRNDCIDVFQLLTKKISIYPYRWMYYLRVCCEFDSIQIMKFLMSQYPYNMDKFEYLKLACSKNSLKIAKFLESLESYKIQDYQKLFTTACTYGCKTVCEWLYSMKGDSVIENVNELFNQACFIGSLETAVYLYSIVKNKPEFDILRAFETSVLFVQLDILQWMMTLNNLAIENEKKKVFAKYYEESLRFKNHAITSVAKILNL